MGELKLKWHEGCLRRDHGDRCQAPMRIPGNLLAAEINEKRARSIKYRLTIAKLPPTKDIADFQFDGTPINQTLVNDLATGGFIAHLDAGSPSRRRVRYFTAMGFSVPSGRRRFAAIPRFTILLAARKMRTLVS
jgi:IstB-like ATP binding protein